jgi:hypothetical protein
MQQPSWTFRIVDQETGAPVPGVPVTVLDDHDVPLSYWVSDAAGLVAVPRAERPRLRLRVGLRSEEPIELDTRQLGDATVPLAAAQRAQPVGPAHGVPVDPALAPPNQSLHPAASPPHVLRFSRVGVFGSGQRAPGAPLDLAGFHAGERAAPVRYGVLLETEALWQSVGTESGDLLYSVSLSPGDEARAVVMDGRWRRQAQRERPLQIVAKMIGTQLLGDQQDAVPLEPCAVGDLAGTSAETVAFLADRTTRVAAALRRRPLGVTEFQGEPTEPGALRTVRNQHPDAVVTYHFVEPLERYRVVVRRPRARPAILVPFRLPNLATREVVTRFGHVLKRALLDRALLPDLEAVLGNAGPVAAGNRFFAHLTANLPYYSATIIAAGDPAQRHLALAKLTDAAGRVLTDVIENTVVGRVGNYVAFPLRGIDYLPSQWRPVLRDDPARLERLSEDLTVVLPIPGVWIKAESTMPLEQGARDQSDAAEARDRRTRRLRG